MDTLSVADAIALRDRDGDVVVGYLYCSQFYLWVADLVVLDGEATVHS